LIGNKFNFLLEIKKLFLFNVTSTLNISKSTLNRFLKIYSKKNKKRFYFKHFKRDSL